MWQEGAKRHAEDEDASSGVFTKFLPGGAAFFLLGFHLLIGAECLISLLALGGIGLDTGEALGQQERKEEKL